MASPIPLDAPVIHTTLPLRFAVSVKMNDFPSLPQTHPDQVHYLSFVQILNKTRELDLNLALQRRLLGWLLKQGLRSHLWLKTTFFLNNLIQWFVNCLHRVAYVYQLFPSSLSEILTLKTGLTGFTIIRGCLDVTVIRRMAIFFINYLI